MYSRSSRLAPGMCSIFASLVLCGCGGGGGTPPPAPQPDTAGPLIENASISVPPELRFTGGDITISAVVSDGSGVKSVQALIRRRSDGATWVVVMNVPFRGSTYSCVFSAPGNSSNDGTAMNYDVSIVARDQLDNLANMAIGSFAVPAPGGSPNPP